MDRENKELLLLGDTNCDLSNKVAGLSTEGNARHTCNLYELFSFTQLIEEPTRVTLSSATFIDHIATTCPRNIVEAGVRKISLSDHYMEYCIRKQNGSITKDHKMIKTRKMNKFIEGEFLADVASVCWEHVVTVSDNINSLVNDWSAIFSALIEKHAPLREMRVSEKYCPWIGRDLKNLMRTRDKLKRAAIKRESPILMDSYRQTRNRVNLLNKQLKKQHYTNKISSNKGNLKDSWKTINELLNKRSKSCNIDCVKDSDSVVTRTEDIANVMNSYFCSIATELANEIDHSSNPLLSGEYHINDKSEKFNFRPINVQDIRDALAKAKISKSFGHDNISYFFLKLALPYIENSLAILFNTSIETSIFPDAWKLARVTPIFKDGDKDDKSNYRPISVLPAISRLFEKLITDQL